MKNDLLGHLTSIQETKSQSLILSVLFQMKLFRAGWMEFLTIESLSHLGLLIGSVTASFIWLYSGASPLGIDLVRDRHQVAF